MLAFHGYNGLLDDPNFNEEYLLTYYFYLKMGATLVVIGAVVYMRDQELSEENVNQPALEGVEEKDLETESKKESEIEL